MAWHILHGLLEQVRTHSTFPGKLWIVMMFIFRIIVVARIGDMVYHDEQHNFICNTLTPGCPNVCFNQFSPISQLRFWSLMVLTIATPGILFCIYGSHKMYHACVKFSSEDEDKMKNTGDDSSDLGSAPPYRPPSMKRKRNSSYPFSNATAPQQLYVVRRLNSKNLERSKSSRDKKTSDKTVFGEEQDPLVKRKGSPDDMKFNVSLEEDARVPRRWQYWAGDRPPTQNYPIYADRHGRKVEYIKEMKPFDEMKARKESKRVLENPLLYRAYWWHVVVRTIFEVAFLLGQYYLYGFFVPELFECTRAPCPKTVDCYVSRPMEKTCLAFLMFGLGSISCFLSICEFWSLGWQRFLYAVCCRGHKMTYEEKRLGLARLAKENQHNDSHHSKPSMFQQSHKDEILMVHRRGHFASQLSLESDSSETTVESV